MKAALDYRNAILQLAPSHIPLDGRYEHLQALNGTGGRGHFSVVFRATEIATDRPVALKFFVDDGHGYRRACFERECRLLEGHLRGEQSIVQTLAGLEVLNVPVTGPGLSLSLEFPFIALEWMPHGDLTQFCSAPKDDLFGLRKRLLVFRGLCRVVSKLHSLDCAHRDLKPDNFLLANAGQVKLSDFGTAKLLVPGEPDLLAAYSAPVGDLRYCAPEVVCGVGLEPGSAQLADLYSLGAMLFEMVTGQPLFAHTMQSTAKIMTFCTRMHALPEARRRQEFISLIEGAAWAIPPVRDINPLIPKAVHSQLDELVGALANLDYRKRLQKMERAHRMTQICELLLNQEQRRREKRSRKVSKGEAHA